MKFLLSILTYLPLFLIIFFIKTQSLYAGSNVKGSDSLNNVDFDYLYHQIRKNIDKDSRSIYLKEFLEKAKRENNAEELLNGYRNYVHYSSEILIPAYADSMVLAAEKTKNIELISNAYLSRGIAHYGLKNYAKASKDYLIAYDLSFKIQDSYLQHKIKYNIAHLKYYLGHYSDAIILFNECIEFFKNDNSRAYLNSIHSIALCYNRMGDIGLSEDWVNRGIHESERIRDNSMYAYFQHLSGVNEFFKENYHLTINYLASSLPLIQEKGDFANEAVGNFYIGKAYWKLDKRSLAISYFEKMDEALIRKNYTRSDLREAYELLIQHYQNKNNLHKQLLYTKKLSTVDSILRENQQTLNPQIHKQFDTKNLQFEKNKAQKNLLESRKTIMILIGIIFLFIFMILYSIFRYHKIQKENKSKFLALMNNSKSAVKTINSSVSDRDISGAIKAVALQLEKFESNKKYLEKDITLVSLASSFKSNTNYLSLAINQLKNKKFPDYINDLKTQHIIDLLKSEKKYRYYTNAALAEEAGFSSTQRFTNSFKANTGLTPGYFIAQLNKSLAKDN